MIIARFVLVEPFSTTRRQFEAIRAGGIEQADLTDNHDGALLGGTDLCVDESGQSPGEVAGLFDAGFDGPTTLEVAGADAVKVSAQRLTKCVGGTTDAMPARIIRSIG